MQCVDGDQSRQVKIFLPAAGGPLFIGLLALFLFARPLLLLADGGTCRHILTGEYIYRHGAIPTTNYVWSIDPKAPWLTHELFCDLIFGIGAFTNSLNWVVLSSALAISLAFTWSYQMARARGSGMLGSLFLLLLALEASTMHWSARPHLFSYLCLLISYYLVFIKCNLQGRNLAWLSLLFVCWSNLHGSFVLGILMLVCAIVGRQQEIGNGLRALAVVVISSCLNLRGMSFFSYVAGYISSSSIAFNSDEWRSLDFSLGVPVWAFLLLAFITILGFVYSHRKPPLGEFLFLGALFGVSLYAMRMIPYFALIAVPAIAYASVSGRWSGPEPVHELEITSATGVLKEAATSPTRMVGGFTRNLLQLESRLSERELSTQKFWPFYVGAAAVMSFAFLLLPSLKIQDFDPVRLPVRSVDVLKNANLKFGFVRDNWGDYLYWRTRKPVFIDDKTDFYPKYFLQDYSAIYHCYPGWSGLLDRYGFQFILVPKGLPLAYFLKTIPDWRLDSEDDCSVLFVRSSAVQSGAKNSKNLHNDSTGSANEE